MSASRTTQEVEKESNERESAAREDIGTRIRPMNDADLDRILELRTVVRWSADPRAFDLLRGVRDARWAVAEAGDGALVGMAGAVPLGRVGILCHLAVHDEHRRLGLGGRLSSWAVAYLGSRGARTVRLYSTAGAEGLYRCMGFRGVAPRTVYRLEAGARRRKARTEADGYRVERLVMEDLPEVYGLDHWTHGGDRSALIFATLRLHPGRGFVARDSSGRVKGYLISGGTGRATRVGPFVAESPAARLLLENALRGPDNDGDDTPAPVEVTVPGPASGPAHDLLTGFGFTGREDRLRMELGEVEGPRTPGLVQYGTTPYLAT